MSDTVEKLLACRKEVEREIGRDLTPIEQNIVRVAFLNGQNGVYNDIIARTAEIEVEIEQAKKEAEEKRAKILALQEHIANRPVLTIELSEQEVTIALEDGTEVVHWVDDEWIEDPSLTATIANAIIMAHVQPEKLIQINQHHIDSQRSM